MTNSFSGRAERMWYSIRSGNSSSGSVATSPAIRLGRAPSRSRLITRSLLVVSVAFLCLGSEEASAGEKGTLYVAPSLSRFANLVSISSSDDPYADETILGQGEWNLGGEIRYRRRNAEYAMVSEFYGSLYKIGENVSFAGALSFLPEDTILLIGLPIRGRNVCGKEWRLYFTGLDVGVGAFSLETEESNSFEGTLTVSKETHFAITASQSFLALRHKHLYANFLRMDFFVSLDGVAGAGITCNAGVGF